MNVDDVVVKILGEAGDQRSEKLNKMVHDETGTSRPTIARHFKTMMDKGILQKEVLDGPSSTLYKLTSAGVKRYQYLTRSWEKKQGDSFPEKFQEYLERFEGVISRRFDKNREYKITQFKKSLLDILGAYPNPFIDKANASENLSDQEYHAVVFFLASRDIINNLFTISREAIARCIGAAIDPMKIEYFAGRFAEHYGFERFTIMDTITVYQIPESEILPILQHLCHLIIDKWFIDNNKLFRKDKVDFIKDRGWNAIKALRDTVGDSIYRISTELREFHSDHVEQFITVVFERELVKMVGDFVSEIMERDRIQMDDRIES
jgi:DNA-binding HxlR family transcriptional regulator